MNYSYFPRNDDIPESIKRVFNIFKNHENEIDSFSNDSTNEGRLSSDDVLRLIESDLEEERFLVEKVKLKRTRLGCLSM